MHIILSKPRGHFSSWWRHQMETFSTLLAICAGNSPVTGKFPAQRPVTWSFDVFFDQRLYKRLSKQSWAWWFETPSRPLWRHCNDTLLWIQPRITKTFGFDTSLNWFYSYLQGRLQFTEYNGVCSDVVNLSTGVPQGSILGPLLFIIYMNDIHAATSNFRAILYADDTNLVSPLCSFSSSNSLNSNNLSEVTTGINKELSFVQEWLLINKLSVNINKTKFMMFHHPQRKIEHLVPALELNSEPLERVSEFNFLGLTLDEHISWKPHVQKIANKISRTIGILRRLKNILPTPVLLTLYNTLILPHFHYGLLNWGFSMGRLQLLQKRSVRVISSSKYNAHTDPLFKKLRLIKLADLFTLNVLKMYYKFKHACLPSHVENMFWRILSQSRARNPSITYSWRTHGQHCQWRKLFTIYSP